MPAWIGSIWKMMAGQRLRYGGAIVALIVASCFLYLAPLVPQVVLDGVLLARPDGQTSSAVVRRCTSGLAGFLNWWSIK